MDEQTSAEILAKENKKEARQLYAVMFIVLVIFVARYFSHQYNMGQIQKASADLLADNVETRLAAVEMLIGIDEMEAKAALLPAVKDKNSGIRNRAVSGISGWKDDRALAVLLEAIKDKDDNIRCAAASALLIFTRAGTSSSGATAEQKNAASSGLNQAFAAKDYPVIDGAIVFFVAIGKVGSEPILISLLETRGTKEMAEIYLNCGNAELEAAAEKWAGQHNYRIEVWKGNQPIPAGAVWGSDRSE